MVKMEEEEKEEISVTVKHSEQRAAVFFVQW
jgi:hypothetical protein